MRSLSTWHFILDNLERNLPVMLLYVLDSQGSSPGRRGFFMAVNTRGEMAGSIGGGIMEHKWVEVAKERLRETGEEERTFTLKRQVHDKSSYRDQSGMICSGEQTIFLYRVTHQDARTIKALIQSIQNFRRGELTLSPNGISFRDQPGVDDFQIGMEESRWVYKEKTGYKNDLTIIGGGHCSLALSKLMRDLDFYVRVYDDRPELNTMQENNFAHEKHVLKDFSELSARLPNPESHYVVIMTMGYRTDAGAVKALAGREFKYCGLLGSSKKIATMMEELRKENVSSEWLNSLHTPIGLNIKSQTPEEIAVSIAAEIISIRNS